MRSLVFAATLFLSPGLSGCGVGILNVTGEENAKVFSAIKGLGAAASKSKSGH